MSPQQNRTELNFWSSTLEGVFSSWLLEKPIKFKDTEIFSPNNEPSGALTSKFKQYIERFLKNA